MMNLKFTEGKLLAYMKHSKGFSKKGIEFGFIFKLRLSLFHPILLQLDINKLNKKKYQARTGTEARARGDTARRRLPARQEERPEKRGARRS